MKRYWCFFLPILFLLAGCSTEKQYVEGMSLGNAGYTIVVPEILCVDINGNETSYDRMTQVQDYTGDTASQPLHAGDGYTRVYSYFFTPYSLGALDGPTVMWLQAVPRKEINRHSYLRVNAVDYKLSELLDKAVYQDQDFLILNLYDLVEDKDFAATLQEEIDRENESLSQEKDSGLKGRDLPDAIYIADYQYLLDFNEYIHTEIGNLLEAA